MQKISEIKEALAACTIEQLPELMSIYESDERNGVQVLLQKAQRRIQTLEAEKERIESLKVFEKQYDMYSYICGIDEAGRGPFAGPVCAGAVILPKDSQLLYLNDSKKLSEKKREELFDQIKDYAVSYGIGFASPERIDEINILQATYEAMRDAVSQLSPQPDLLLNDAVTIPKLPMKQVPIVHGDARSVSIAAASILAKVTRDRLMRQYDEVYPEYGFAGNKGYGTADHIAAIRKYGPTPIHRRSFIHDYI
ncbi:MAG: ribonuclease HII [Lachnospiraceae bacterium]|nr:ribonuclease HII [Lachnospiraceae bacterium]